MTSDLPAPEQESAITTPIADTQVAANMTVNEQAESHVTEAQAVAAKSPIRTTIKVVPEDEPYMLGQCTVAIVLTLQPSDGHAEGRQVLIGVRSHDEEPLIGLARLNALSLPGEIVQLLERYELSLPTLGQAKAEKESRAKAKQEQAEAKRKQAQAKKAAKGEVSKPTRKSLLATPPHDSAPQPDGPVAPPTPSTEGSPSTPDIAPAAPAAQITLFG